MLKIRIIVILSVFNYCIIGLYAQFEDNINVAPKHYTADSVVIVGYRPDKLYLQPMTVSVINKDQITERQTTSLLPMLTEYVPSLFTTSRGILGYGVSGGSAGGMSLRGVGGSPTAGLLVLIDGHPQYMGLMGHPIADAYQSMLAEEVQVVRGPASALYGSNAMGGVINIVTKKNTKDGINLQANVDYGSWNTLSTGITSSIRKGRFSSMITGSYDRTDGHRSNMNFEQYGGYTKLGYELSRKWNITTDLNLIHFKASNPGTISIPLIDNDSRITRGMASFSLGNNYKNTFGAFIAFYNWGQHKINDGYKHGEDALSTRFRSHDLMTGIIGYQTLSAWRGNKIQVGVDFQHFGGNTWDYYIEDGYRRKTANRTENEIASYISFHQKMGDHLKIDIGLRADYHSRTGIEWIPQIGMAYNPKYNKELKASVSKGFRNPTIRELYLFKTQNANLKPERLINYEIAWTQCLLGNSLSYAINLFHINGNNMIQQSIVDGRPQNINSGKIRNWGAETELDWQVSTKWKVNFNYSWLDIKYTVLAAPEHKLYLGVDYKQNRWSVASGIQYIKGLHKSVNPDEEESFILWNVRTSFRVSNTLSLRIRGENLLAYDYEINKGYPMPRATIFGGITLKL